MQLLAYTFLFSNQNDMNLCFDKEHIHEFTDDYFFFFFWWVNAFGAKQVCLDSRCSSELPKPIKQIQFTQLQNVKYSEIDLKEEKEWKRVFTVYLCWYVCWFYLSNDSSPASTAMVESFDKKS